MLSDKFDDPQIVRWWPLPLIDIIELTATNLQSPIREPIIYDPFNIFVYVIKCIFSGKYNSSFVYCRVKRSPIPLKTSKKVYSIYSNIRRFVCLFP